MHCSEDLTCIANLSPHESPGRKQNQAVIFLGNGLGGVGVDKGSSGSQNSVKEGAVKTEGASKESQRDN